MVWFGLDSNEMGQVGISGCNEVWLERVFRNSLLLIQLERILWSEHSTMVVLVKFGSG